MPVGRAAEVRGARAVAQKTVLPRERWAPRATRHWHWHWHWRAGAGRRKRGAGRRPTRPTRIALAVALALTLTVEGERITAYEVIADPVDPHRLDLAVLEE
ncbi:hypothetical protein [Streptomyces sp. NPDC048309]|uniref:hypothetical protein n=1 Tax=Streptomyces sp. NPDC048309 TaxID=3154618 RepID=UPI0033E37E15